MVQQLNHTKTLEQLPPEKSALLYGFRDLVAHELVVNRRSRKEVVEQLVTRGLPRTAVKQFVDEIAAKVLSKDKAVRRKKYGKMMIGGFITMLLGIGMTVLAYYLVINLGGSIYFLFYGAIGSGLIAFIIGFISWLVNLF